MNKYCGQLAMQIQVSNFMYQSEFVEELQKGHENLRQIKSHSIFSLQYISLPDSTKCLPLHMQYICSLMSALHRTLFTVYWKGSTYNILLYQNFSTHWSSYIYVAPFHVVSQFVFSSYIISSSANTRSAETQRAVLSLIFKLRDSVLHTDHH